MVVEDERGCVGGDVSAAMGRAVRNDDGEETHSLLR